MNSLTKVTATKQTLADHVYTKTPGNIIDIAVPVYAISDHYPVCITRRVCKSFDSDPVHKFITHRDSKIFNFNLFLTDLENQPWSVIDIFEDATYAFDSFTEFFNSVVSNHAPKKETASEKAKTAKLNQ